MSHVLGADQPDGACLTRPPRTGSLASLCSPSVLTLPQRADAVTRAIVGSDSSLLPLSVARGAGDMAAKRDKPLSAAASGAATPTGGGAPAAAAGINVCPRAVIEVLDKLKDLLSQWEEARGRNGDESPSAAQDKTEAELAKVRARRIWRRRRLMHGARRA